MTNTIGKSYLKIRDLTSTYEVLLVIFFQLLTSADLDPSGPPPLIHHEQQQAAAAAETINVQIIGPAAAAAPLSEGGGEIQQTSSDHDTAQSAAEVLAQLTSQGTITMLQYPTESDFGEDQH